MLIKSFIGHLWLDFSNPPVHLKWWKEDGEVFLRWWRLNAIGTSNAKINRLRRDLKVSGPGDAGSDHADLSSNS